MASFSYRQAKLNLGRANEDTDAETLDFRAEGATPAGDDLRILLVQNTTTADTETLAEIVGSGGNGTTTGFTTLAECTVASYADVSLAGETWAVVSATKATQYDADDAVWATLEAGQSIDGAVIYKFVTNQAASIPIFYIDIKALNGGSSLALNGGGLTLQWNANGIARIT